MIDLGLVPPATEEASPFPQALRRLPHRVEDNLTKLSKQRWLALVDDGNQIPQPVAEGSSARLPTDHRPGRRLPCLGKGDGPISDKNTTISIMSSTFLRSAWGLVTIYALAFLLWMRGFVADGTRSVRRVGVSLVPWWLVFLGSLFLAASAMADTPVSGAIAVNTHWTEADSPYLVSGDVVVQNGAMLTLDPGVIVYMGANASLTVQAGSIRAQGTAANPIRVLSDKTRLGQTAAPGNWRQWVFNPGTLDTRLDHVLFEHGSGLAVEPPHARLRDNRVRHCSAVAHPFAAARSAWLLPSRSPKEKQGNYSHS